jgi:hypothetical protein
MTDAIADLGTPARTSRNEDHAAWRNAAVEEGCLLYASHSFSRNRALSHSIASYKPCILKSHNS